MMTAVSKIGNDETSEFDLLSNESNFSDEDEHLFDFIEEVIVDLPTLAEREFTQIEMDCLALDMPVLVKREFTMMESNCEL